MLAFPNAKINIGLNIIEKRPDGFHNILSIFYPISLCDILEIIKDEGSNKGKLQFQSTGLEIPSDSTNLCIKAYNLLKSSHRQINLSAVKNHLHKIIPIGAGLGGGSSDAVYTLKILNDLFELSLSEEAMLNYARQLGSDCPFFVINKPVLAYEKGDKFAEIDLNLKGYFLVLVYPNVQISTQQVYSMIIPKKPHTSIKDVIKLPITEWKNFLFNDFEPLIFKKYPLIKEIKTQLYNLGAIYASMTGSGSAVYGIFKDKILIPEKFKKYFIWTQML